MSLREFIGILDDEGQLLRVRDMVDPYLEMAQILADEQDKAVMFEKVKDSDYRVVGGVCSSRERFSRSLGVEKESLLFKINEAIENPVKPEIKKSGACQEVVEKDVDLRSLPILSFTSQDMGPYITSGVYMACDRDYGFNMSFHRATPISSNRLVARVCHRDLHSYLKRAGGVLDVAICIGLDPSFLLAASVSLGVEVDELGIAGSMKPAEMVKCQTNDLLVPADAEFVLEGRFTGEVGGEGPFPDVTRTLDVVRQEPVIEIDCITHRKDAIYHALLPASKEHELLMGMPREPVIFNRVNRVCRCRNVLLSHGGCSWLHGIIQIDKREADDGRKALEAAFEAHRSMKHVVVVDCDVDIYSPDDVEWAVATRFQAGKDLIMKEEKGSSLDPSASEDGVTSKVGLDATIPSDKPRECFSRITLGK
ncbi:MAG: UbiD family decarboxylase [Candidatus Altiarchaeales archaeon]|nr:UbiD family decarboxylase [Candidatus Altiarchaeales archaeon]